MISDKQAAVKNELSSPKRGVPSESPQRADAAVGTILAIQLVSSALLISRRSNCRCHRHLAELRPPARIIPMPAIVEED